MKIESQLKQHLVKSGKLYEVQGNVFGMIKTAGIEDIPRFKPYWISPPAVVMGLEINKVLHKDLIVHLNWDHLVNLKIVE